MTIQEAIQLHDDIEKDLKAFISGKLIDFNRATGLSGESIKIDLMPTWVIGGDKPIPIIQNVTLEVKM
jgi:hypothetical protein